MYVYLIFFRFFLYAQTAPKKPDFSAYYYHRKSLFNVLPDTQNEIMFLGDSITDGNEWSEMFQNLKVKNRGISGDVTDGVLYRLSEVTESHPPKVFIMIGVNDLAAGKSVNYILSNYKKIIDRIKQASPDTKIYIQSLLPVNDAFSQFPNHVDKLPEIKQINKRLKPLAKNKGCTYIDLFDDMSTDNDKLSPKYTKDGLHINGKGYLVWKADIKKYVNTN